MFDLEKAESTTPLDTNAVIEHFFRSGEPYIEGIYLVSGDGQSRISWKWLLLNAKHA